MLKLNKPVWHGFGTADLWMSAAAQNRRRSDLEEFVEPDVDAVALEIFSRYAGEQPLLIDGTPATATLFNPDYCPELRVMKMAGRLAVAVNRRAQEGTNRPGTVLPLRVPVEDIMLAALLHDVGKQHEDCAPLLELMQTTSLRARDDEEAGTRDAYLLGIVRDVHCRKGPCMLDRLREAGRPELNNPFIATAARRHGDDYDTNRAVGQGCWWAREINIITIADDYDAMTSAGPERAYKAAHISKGRAAELIKAGIAAGRYDREIALIFLNDIVQ